MGRSLYRNYYNAGLPNIAEAVPEAVEFKVSNLETGSRGC